MLQPSVVLGIIVIGVLISYPIHATKRLVEIGVSILMAFLMLYAARTAVIGQMMIKNIQFLHGYPIGDW